MVEVIVFAADVVFGIGVAVVDVVVVAAAVAVGLVVDVAAVAVGCRLNVVGDKGGVSQIVVAGIHDYSSQDGRLVQLHWRWHHDYLSYPWGAVLSLVPGVVLAIVLVLLALVLVLLALVLVNFLAHDLLAMMLVMTMKGQATDVIEVLLDTAVVIVADADHHQQKHHQHHHHQHSVVVSVVVSCTVVVVVIAVLDAVFVFLLFPVVFVPCLSKTMWLSMVLLLWLSMVL